MRPSWALGPLCALGLAALPGWQADLARAEGELARGRYRLAEQSFRELIRVRPNHRVRIGLARALAHGGDCDEALGLLSGLVGVRAWTVDASLAEGRCLQRTGRPWEAVEVYRIAAERVPEKPGPWMALIGVLDALDEPEERDRARDALRLCDGGVELDLVAATEIALRRGGNVDAALDLARRRVGEGPTTALVDGRAWLDAGNPRAAEQVLRGALRRVPGHAQLALWRVEALRRLGDPQAAADALEGPVLRGVADDGLARAIAARVAVDRGDLDGAVAMLSGLGDPDGCEALASRWYAARARGAALDVLAARWRDCELAPARRLEQLVPLEER